MIKNLQKNKGFVILFAVTLSAILLSIALGVTNIAFKEIKFSTSAKDTNDAFFAADSGAEYALFNDKSSPYTSPMSLTLPFSGLGNNNQSCAIVTITKTVTLPAAVSTKLISKGYNTGSNGSACNPPTNSVEREIELNY